MGYIRGVKVSGVYAIRCTVDGRVYVGSSVLVGKRWSNHRKKLEHGTHACRGLLRAFRAYGPDALEYEVLEECPSALLLEREQYWSDRLGSYDQERGFNVRRDVGRSVGVRLPETTRLKMSEAHKGKKQSLEHAARQCEARRGRRNTFEQRLSMGLSNRLYTEEQARQVLRMLRDGGMSGVKIAELVGVRDKFVSKVKAGKVLWVTAIDANDAQNSDAAPASSASKDHQRAVAV